jgi:hypothetical protein
MPSQNAPKIPRKYPENTLKMPPFCHVFLPEEMYLSAMSDAGDTAVASPSAQAQLLNPLEEGRV